MRHVRFRVIRRYLAFRPEDIRSNRCNDWIVFLWAVLVMGPFSYRSTALMFWTGLGFRTSMLELGLGNLNSTFLLDQSDITRVLFGMLGCTKSLEITVGGKLSVAALCYDVQASQHLLVSHVRERDKGPLRRILTM